MGKYKIVEVLSTPKYSGLALFFAAAMATVYPFTQVLGLIHTIDIWFATTPKLNLILYMIFSALFGATLAFQIYTWRHPAGCALNVKARGAGASGIGTLSLFIVSQCPACTSLGALFLPLSAVTFISKASVLINIVVIGLLLFTVYHLGGFRKT